MGSLQLRRLLVNLVLLLVVIGLGGFVWWYNTHATQPLPTLLSLPKSAIKQITITRQLEGDKPEVIQLAKQGDYWYMQQPIHYAANPTRITQLFTLLDETVEASYDAAGKDLKPYALAPGQAALTLNDEKLVFGMDNPVSRKRYILHDGKIKLVSEAVFGLLTGDSIDLLSTKLIPPGRTIKQMSLPSAYTIAGDTATKWQAADAIFVEKWDGQGESKGQIVLNLDDGSIVTLDMLTSEGEVVLGNRAAGLRYKLVEAQRQQLLPPKP